MFFMLLRLALNCYRFALFARKSVDMQDSATVTIQSRNFHMILSQFQLDIFSRNMQKTRTLLGMTLMLGVLTSNSGFADDIRQDELNASLIYAARLGDMNSFNIALGLGANINATDKSGNNAVLAATEGGQHRLLRTLLEKGVNPNTKGASGLSPLTYAAMHGAIDDAGMLLRAGADPDQRNALSDAPLHLAVRFGHIDMVKALAKSGARLDIANDLGETPLISAIQSSNTKALETLLELGANADVTDNTGRSALFWAILENHEDMAKKLIKKGVSFYGLSDGYTPLQMAEIMRHDDVVAMLRQQGATR